MFDGSIHPKTLGIVFETLVALRYTKDVASLICHSALHPLACYKKEKYLSLAKASVQELSNGFGLAQNNKKSLCGCRSGTAPCQRSPQRFLRA
jgi:hypothetical protein